MEVKHILVIRFRQMGDAILATPLLSALHQRFPEAEIDFVLNERIAPLFDGHPAISRIITFTPSTSQKGATAGILSSLSYMKKVWRTVRQTHYDAIIDMRSTVNTMLFALFSPTTPYRIGIRKPYTRFVFNHRFPSCQPDESMIDHNLKLAVPLNSHPSPLTSHPSLSLQITQQEKDDFRQYMAEQGIDFQHPILLVGVTAKLASKTWPEERMTEVLRRILHTYPQLQLIFNYAPGREAENARRIYDALREDVLAEGSAKRLFLSIQAKSPRQLAAMAANCTAYFGNEGGARHIVHAMGKPSFVICSPGASKKTWLPEDDEVQAQGIAASDITDVTHLTAEEQYSLITVDRVWTELTHFLSPLTPPIR